MKKILVLLASTVLFYGIQALLCLLMVFMLGIFGMLDNTSDGHKTPTVLNIWLSMFVGTGGAAYLAAIIGKKWQPDIKDGLFLLAFCALPFSGILRADIHGAEEVTGLGSDILSLIAIVVSWKAGWNAKGLIGKPESNLRSDNAGGHNASSVPANVSDVVKKYRQAAEQGNVEAQYNLGLEYWDVDDIEAVKWLRKAAEQGHIEAQHDLGYAYWNGDGVLPDHVLAYMWFSIAAVNPTRVLFTPSLDELLDNLGKIMTAQQIAEAQQLARKWQS